MSDPFSILTATKDFIRENLPELARELILADASGSVPEGGKLLQVAAMVTYVPRHNRMAFAKLLLREEAVRAAALGYVKPNTLEEPDDSDQPG
jgi:hypothetical protein